MRSAKLFTLCFVIVALFLMTSWAYAATFVVDSLGDVDDGSPYTASDGTNTLKSVSDLQNYGNLVSSSKMLRSIVEHD